MLRWCILGVVASAGVAWIGAMIHASGRAPVGLVSLGIGIALGAILGGIAATMRVTGRSRLILGTIALSLVAVLAQHAWLYLDFRRQWHEARAISPQVALFRSKEFGSNSPWSPQEYFRRELTAERAALWCLDATLVSAAAVGSVALLVRKSD